jgi:HD-like signal output (HDOD) protein
MNHIRSNQEGYFKKIQDYVARMPSLSTTVMKVLEICNNPDASPHDLKQVISLDPVLTGRVLKLINSAYYSLRHPVSSLARAIIMLGLNTIKNLALSFAILENFRGNGSFRAFSTDEFWTHSLSVGVAAKSLAAIKEIPLSEREEYFVAGLLHDLGKLPINNQFPEEYYQVREQAVREQGSLHHTEVALLGLDHCIIGNMIAQKWRLGMTLIESLSHHHNPHESSEQNRFFVSIVSLANLYANQQKLGCAGDIFPDHSLIADLIEKMNVDWKMLYNFREMVLREIQKANIFLQIAQKG